MKAFWIIFCLFFLNKFKGQFIVKIKIIDAVHTEPLPFAKVFYKCNENSKDSIILNIDGEACIKNVKPNSKIDLFFNYYAYQKMDTVVFIKKNVQIIFYLKPDTTIKLDEIDINWGYFYNSIKANENIKENNLNFIFSDLTKKNIKNIKKLTNNYNVKLVFLKHGFINDSVRAYNRIIFNYLKNKFGYNFEKDFVIVKKCVQLSN